MNVMQALKRQIKVARKLYLATHRAAKTRWIVADQRELITKLRVWGQPTLDAERSLQEYISALEPLEDNAGLGKSAKPKIRKPKSLKHTEVLPTITSTCLYLRYAILSKF